MNSPAASSRAILFVGPYPPPFGGIASHIRDVTSDFSAAGIRCHTLSFVADADSHDASRANLTVERRRIRPTAGAWRGALGRLHRLPLLLPLFFKLPLPRAFVSALLRCMHIVDVCRANRLDTVGVYGSEEAVLVPILRRLMPRQRILYTCFAAPLMKPDHYRRYRSYYEMAMRQADRRDFVRGGGRLFTVGFDSLHRTMALGARTMSSPSARAERDFLGANVSPPVHGTTCPDRADGRASTSSPARRAASAPGKCGRRPADVGAGRLVATAVEDGGEIVFVAYRLGRGLVFRPGVRGWSAALDDRRLAARDDHETDMDASAPLDTTLGRLGLIAAALLAAAAVLAERPRLRAAAMAGALVLTPVLLVAEIYDTEQFRTLRDRPAFTAALVAVALVGLAVLAFVMARRPLLLPLLAVGALPFRIPIESAGQTANLLVPLYGVIAAGALAADACAVRGPAPGRHA